MEIIDGVFQQKFIKNYVLALAGVAQWIEHQPVDQRVSSLIPSQGTCLGCRPCPPWGAYKSQPYIVPPLSSL